MTIPRRRRNNKQQPFYAFKDGKVYAANRKARRIAIANNIVIKEDQQEPVNTLTNVSVEGVVDADDKNSSL